jgi:tetratricopeptide (TPR) repeat protein
MGAVQYEIENYVDAVSFFCRANEIFGPNHEEAGHIFCGLAYAHRQLGQFEEASIYFEKALNAKGENLAMDHESVGDLLHEYGVFLMDDWDKLLESAKCFEDALKIRELSHGRDSDKVSDTLFQLSKAYHRIGRIDSALSALAESIRIKETYYLLSDEIGIKSENNDYQVDLLTSYDLLMQLMESGDAPSTVELDLEKADVAYKKGNINMQMKQYPEAISCFDTALIIQTRILGSFHLAVSNTLHNLGSAELKNSDLEHAGHHLEESIMVRRKIIDEDDIEIADSLHNLANVFRKRKEFDRAIQLFEDSSQIKRACLGAGHLSLANTLYALGSVLADVQSFEKAMRCHMDCLRIRRLKLGEEHVSVSDVLFSIGNIYKARSESDREIQVYREALKIRRSNMAENSFEIASVLHNVAAALDASKRYEEALHCYEMVWRILR